MTTARRAGWRFAAATSLGLVALLAGCATPLRVMPLATGQTRVAAYELRGDDPDRLRAEAVRLCGGSADVLRDSVASRAVVGAEDAGRVSRWWTQVQQWGQPAQREAQLVVRCAPSADREVAVARYAPVAAPATANERPWWSSLMFWRRRSDQSGTNGRAATGDVRPSDWSVNFE